MVEGSGTIQLPFRAVQILKTPEIEGVYAVAIGVDGELCRMNDSWEPIEAHARPFPMSIQHAIIVGQHLIATWIDRELLVARMGCLPIDQPFKNGVERGDLRAVRLLEHAVMPEGTIWAHVLDAEPLAMTTMDDGFAFVLWNRGIYGFNANGTERWRAPTPTWPELSHLPMSQETVSLHETDSTIEVWSKAGGCLRLSKSSGEHIGTVHFELEGALSDVYGFKSDRLLLLANGRCYLYREGTKVADLETKGPVQHALLMQDSTWILSGWREEIALRNSGVSILKQDEVVVQHVNKGDQLWLLTNDGKISHSFLTE